MTDCLPFSFCKLSNINYPAPLFNGNCPSSAPLINRLNLKVDLHWCCKAETFQVCEIIRQWRRDRVHRQRGRRKGKQFLVLVVDDFHVAVLLNPKLADDDIVHAACGVSPGVGFVVSMETNVWVGEGIRQPLHSWLKTNLLGQLQCDGTPGLGFYTLPPKFEFGVNGAVEHKVLLEALSLKGTDWGVMADLLRHPPEAQIFPAKRNKGQSHSGRIRRTSLLTPSPDELKGLPQQRVERFPSSLPLGRDSGDGKRCNALESWFVMSTYQVTDLVMNSKTHFCGTFILSMESVVVLAWWMRWVCSMYSDNLCRKLRGSLNITGMAIFDNSYKRWSWGKKVI